MIIKCPSCQTKYKIADEKIQPTTKVKCKKCQTVFRLPLIAKAPAKEGEMTWSGEVTKTGPSKDLSALIEEELGAEEPEKLEIPAKTPQIEKQDLTAVKPDLRREPDTYPLITKPREKPLPLDVEPVPLPPTKPKLKVKIM